MPFYFLSVLDFLLSSTPDIFFIRVHGFFDFPLCAMAPHLVGILVTEWIT